MIRPCRGKSPQIDPTARIAENATIIGDITLEKDVSIWYNAVARADSDSMHIGEGTNIQDGCILHNDSGHPLNVGRNCVVGHGAILHSCTVGDGTLVGMGSILLTGCKIGEGSLVGAGALVTGNREFPPHSLLMGVPARVVRTLSEEEMENTLREARDYIGKAREELPAASDHPGDED